jgi:F-type H+-transporting ATPase subunit delta
MAWRWQDIVARLRRQPGQTPPPADTPEPAVEHTQGAGPAPQTPEPPQPPAILEPPTPPGTGEPSDPLSPTESATPPDVQTMTQGNGQPDTDGGVATPRRRSRGAIDPAARRYAAALVEMAEESGAAVEIGAEVRQLAELLETQPQLRVLMASPALSSEDRRGMLQRVFQGRVSDTTYRFLQVLSGKNRLAQLPAVLDAYQSLLDERRGIVEVDAYVARPMDAAQKDQVARRVGEVLKREVVLHQYVNPELIGGLVLRVGDQLIDGSVSTQLKNLRQKLIEAGRTRARNQSL